jgi:hypothetical protein
LADQTDQVAPIVQLRRVSPQSGAVEHLLPFHQVTAAAELLELFAGVIATFSAALVAFDAKYVELAFDITEYEQVRAIMPSA